MRLKTALLLLCAGVATALAHHNEQHTWLLSFIPETCCVTNDCCWEIQERELIDLGRDEYEIRATGQIIKRTAFSPDGKFYRCACDYDPSTTTWVRHDKANTRCIFAPHRGF